MWKNLLRVCREKLWEGAEIDVVNFTNTFEAGGRGVGIFTLTDTSGFFDIAPFLDTEIVTKGDIKIKQ